jgi:diaminohydroxyphosphoribosylaminopyrimidine deaminase/5-amino-6-(5-phosphoribosylamino)uracil reductase
LADDPQLNCRVPGMSDRSPVRVVLDADLQLPLTSRLVETARTIPLWVVAGGTADPAREKALVNAGAVVLRVDAPRGRLDLAAALKQLAGLGITRVLVEGGPKTAAAFLQADLVDEAVLFRSPMTIGVDGIDALDTLPLSALTHSPRLKSLGVETVGADTVETFERV